MDTGDAAVAKYGDPFPKETFEGIGQTDAVLFGAAGNPNTVKVLMGFRLGFNLYANVRPIRALPGSNALRPKADLIVVRENLEGLYCGVGYIAGEHYVNLRIFTKQGMERILRFCFQLAHEGGPEEGHLHPQGARPDAHRRADAPDCSTQSPRSTLESRPMT